MATVDIVSFGAIPNTTGTITAGSQQLTLADATGWQGSAGATITVAGAGALGTPLTTTVQGAPVGNVLTLALAAGTSVTGAVVSAENGLAIQRAIDAMREQGGGVVHIGTGAWSFSFTLRLYEWVSIVGDGPASQLSYVGNGIAINWQATVAIGSNIEARLASLRLTGGPQSQIGVLLNDIYGARFEGVVIDVTQGAGGFLTCAVGAVGWDVNCAFCAITGSRFQVSGDGLRLMGGVYTMTAINNGFGQNSWGVNAGQNYVDWHPDMCWPQGLTIQVMIGSVPYYFQVTSPGRSGLQEPAWPTSPQLGQTVVEQLAPTQGSCTPRGLEPPPPPTQPVQWSFIGVSPAARSTLPGRPFPINVIALSGCDLEGNYKGGVTGWLYSSSIRNCYYEGATGPFVQIPYPQFCKGLEISNNFISAWGPNNVPPGWTPGQPVPVSYAIDIFTGSGVLGLVIESNRFGGLPPTATPPPVPIPFGPIRAAAIRNAVIRANLYDGPIFASQATNSAELGILDRSIDAGLQLVTYRFVLDNFKAELPGAPKTKLPLRLDSTASPPRTQFFLPSGGYVMAVSGFTDTKLRPQSSYDVQVFANGMLQLDVTATGTQTFEQMATVVYPHPELLTPPGPLIPNTVVRLDAGAAIGVSVTPGDQMAFLDPPTGIHPHTLFVDVVVGLGITGE
jgi:hypothetical protein